ncbi:MAG: isopenicillin N synthase family oxygenase [Kofleriaceae bacterium]|jgi:isopenicillin N synthase-like dioxygenase|nr:isopenicillin N synthase family oxygenase [Kofleriaceae bacterium]MBP6835774.1 isopenicillin N synthase family oxygenase [Kofleriaceae bacterium]MBP9206160.1 isopenicillin N synthase family oxygenase [Kofleriaceae bacterium]
MQNIPVVDLHDWHAGGERRQHFATAVGDALADLGFFAVRGHGIAEALSQDAYAVARRFFAADPAAKARYHRAGAAGQRGYTGFGTEHAKDSKAPDLKEFWQVGRTGVPDDHPVHRPYGPNFWPDDLVPEFRATMSELYQRLDALGGDLLEACALYLGEPAARFRSMVSDSDTIVRVLYYPPVPADAPPGAVRSAAHEDINLITLLSGATAEGLELLRRDGAWMPVHTGLDTIVVDSGDMLQNVSNGLFKSTTHRVVNPVDRSRERFSMPCFVHPRTEVDLTPLPSCVARTGGQARYPSITAGAYLDQRLREIGLKA